MDDILFEFCCVGAVAIVWEYVGLWYVLSLWCLGVVEHD